MTKGRIIKLLLDGTAVAVSTGLEVRLTQSLVQYEPIPGTTEDDGWAHVRPTTLGWSLQNTGFYTTSVTELKKLINTTGEVGISISVSDNVTMTGTGVLAEVLLSGETGSLAKTGIKIKCNNFPSLETVEEEITTEE